MHEAGLVAIALQAALAGRARAGRRRPRVDRISRLELDVLDPVEVSVDSALMHLEVAMSRCGLAGVPVTVRVVPVACVACGATGVPRAGEPFCASCGWPLARSSGEPLRISAATT